MLDYANADLNNLREALLDHPLYDNVASLADLKLFMEDHVFAVWDFMSLLKRLQQDMTCIRVPWFPAENERAARLINDIVIGEETDVDPDGDYVSHLDLYLRAMEDVGASTLQIRDVLFPRAGRHSGRSSAGAEFVCPLMSGLSSRIR